MKRWTFRIAMCLLLGVVTTVAVAWGLARAPRFGPWNSGKYTSFPGTMDRYFPEIPEIDYAQFSGSVYQFRGAEYAGLSYGPAKRREITRVRCGFPVLALCGDARRDLAAQTESQSMGFTCTLPLLGERFLPLRPIFPGFLINTLFYAVIWFGLFFGPGAIRRSIRKKHLRGRGRCVKCGYDLRGTPDDVVGCSECGFGR